MSRMMTRWKRAWVLSLLVVGMSAPSGEAQTKFNSGQNVQPVFEGWEKNPDGSFNLMFGYLNRNYQERPHVPVGPNNRFSPGAADRGQPSHFYTRRQNYVFKVRVPADFGDADLVWTVTHAGRADTATGSLWPVWEVDEAVIKANRGMGISGSYVDNHGPNIGIDGPDTHTVAAGESVTLVVVAGDDGIPGPNPESAARRGNRRGRPGPDQQNVLNPRAAVATGLAVTWLQHRGPGAVSFAPMMPPLENGRATTTASFNVPGTYILRAVADDTVLTATVDITVVVEPAE